MTLRPATCLVVTLALSACAIGTPGARSSSPPVLEQWLASQMPSDVGPVRYAVGEWSDGARSLRFILLSGPAYCGSGGCNLWILRPTAAGFERVGDVSLVRGPVRVLASETNGLPDIGVHVAGGEIVDGYEAALPFDGRAYASNPSVSPARRNEGAALATVIPADAVTTSLKP